MKQYTQQMALNVINFFQKADLAIGDITITYEREQAVDFTMPFMNLGTYMYEYKQLFTLLSIIISKQLITYITFVSIFLGVSILFKKPMKKPPNLFSFMSPLSLDVWIYMATAYLGVSVLLFILARYELSFMTYPNTECFT